MNMPITSPSRLFEKGDEGRPPVGVLALVAGLAMYAALSFLFAVLSQFSGPAVETGISPQTVAALQWGGIGTILAVLAVFVYQQRPVGWYGTFITAIISAIQAVKIDLSFGPVLIIYLTFPLIVVTLLLVRRDIFFDR